MEIVKDTSTVFKLVAVGNNRRESVGSGQIVL